MMFNRTILLTTCLLVFGNTQAQIVKESDLITAPENGSIWQTEGYGYLLEVVENKIRFYDITSKYCLINYIETGEYRDTSIKINNETAVFEWGSIHPVPLTRLKTLPTMCRDDLIISSKNPEYKFNPVQVFDIFWNTFAENFSFSTERHWNWDEKYPLWRNEVSTQTTEVFLAELLELLLLQLGDAHSQLESIVGRPVAWPNQKWNDFKKNTIESRLIQQKKYSSPYQFHQSLTMKHREIIHSYFVRKTNKKRLSRAFLIGQLPNDLSYLSIDDMGEFTEEETIESDLMAVDTVMKELSTTLPSARGLVIDLRWNSGGFDVVANRILSHFIERPLYIGSKQTKISQGFTKPKPIIVDPANVHRYQGPIVVLTSGLTMSAGEIFLIGLAARENVTIIGEASNGGFSDSLPKQLPNGWTFSLSNERYFDFEHKSHEFSGYPVEQHHQYLDANALNEGKDYALESAMELLDKMVK